MIQEPKKIRKQVKNGEISKCCFECAEKYRDLKPYSGVFTTYMDICPICKIKTGVSSASKLFGYYKML